MRRRVALRAAAVVLILLTGCLGSGDIALGSCGPAGGAPTDAWHVVAFTPEARRDATALEDAGFATRANIPVTEEESCLAGAYGLGIPGGDHVVEFRLGSDYEGNDFEVRVFARGPEQDLDARCRSGSENPSESGHGRGPGVTIEPGEQSCRIALFISADRFEVDSWTFAWEVAWRPGDPVDAVEFRAEAPGAPGGGSTPPQGPGGGP